MIAAASPFMKTLRSSFSPAASPGREPTTSTGIPSGPKISAKRSAPSPDASAGVRRPVLGNDADQRDVHELGRERGGELLLERRGGGVQVGVEDAVGEARRRRSTAASRATAAALMLRTTSAPLTASSPLAAFVIPVEAPDRVPPAHHAARRREIGRDPAAGLAEAEHRDLDQSLPSTISRSPFRS